MRKFASIVLSVALLAGAQYASAQSFRGIVRKAVQKGINQSTNRQKQLEREVDAMVGKRNNKNIEDEAPTVRLPKTHTALFAPLGYPIEAHYGAKSVKAEMPPKSESAQVSWSGNRPTGNEMDNKSLVEEYVLLKDCLDKNYISNLGPAGMRFHDHIESEIFARADRLNEMVEAYNEVWREYDNSPEWVVNNYHRTIAGILESREYKTLIRSSIAPLAMFLDQSTLAYFQAHGGLENAHKANWTVWDPKPQKQSVSTSESASGQSGTVVDDHKVDVGGVIYILHDKNRRASHAFISQLSTTAVAGKDIVIPDYITYEGQKYPVESMRAELFSNTAIRSVKLPATLEEIPNAAFRNTPITQITIPASVQIVQGSAFADCKNLDTVVFEGESVSELHGCFQRCTALRSIKFPKKVGLMSYDMFLDCTSLSDVVLPENLTEVYNSMFKGCKSLKTVNIPSGVKTIGQQAFAESGITSIDISHATVFEADCFYNCKALRNVKLNASLKDVFLSEIYVCFMGCPLLQIKYENNRYVYPAGLVFVETE